MNLVNAPPENIQKSVPTGAPVGWLWHETSAIFGPRNAAILRTSGVVQFARKLYPPDLIAFWLTNRHLDLEIAPLSGRDFVKPWDRRLSIELSLRSSPPIPS